MYEFGRATAGEPDVRIVVSDPRAYSTIALGGSLGAAEAYVRGYWETDDLFSALRFFVLNATMLSSLDHGGARLLAPARAAWRWMRRNTPAGSRRNIAAHYDLSNEFFALMLDPTMTYSSGIFAGPETSLQEASTAKYERICRKLQLSPQDHVLEIGSGQQPAIHLCRPEAIYQRGRDPQRRPPGQATDDRYSERGHPDGDRRQGRRHDRRLPHLRRRHLAQPGWQGLVSVVARSPTSRIGIAVPKGDRTFSTGSATFCTAWRRPEYIAMA